MGMAKQVAGRFEERACMAGDCMGKLKGWLKGANVGRNMVWGGGNFWHGTWQGQFFARELEGDAGAKRCRGG